MTDPKGCAAGEDGAVGEHGKREAYIEIKKIIDDCRDCPHLKPVQVEDRDEWMNVCGMLYRTMQDFDGIPEWCPFVLETVTRRK